MKKLAIFLSLVVLMAALCIPASAAPKNLEMTATYGTPSTHLFNEKNQSADAVNNPLKDGYTSNNTAKLYIMYDEDNLYIRLLADRRPNGFNIYFFTDLFMYGADMLVYDCAYRYNASTEKWDHYTALGGDREPKVEAVSVKGNPVENARSLSRGTPQSALSCFLN